MPRQQSRMLPLSHHHVAKQMPRLTFLSSLGSSVRSWFLATLPVCWDAAGWETQAALLVGDSSGSDQSLSQLSSSAGLTPFLPEA